jgi:hypothetical protein
MSNLFAAYATGESEDLEKGKSYFVYKVRVDGGTTFFLVSTRTGELKWFTSMNFRV